MLLIESQYFPPVNVIKTSLYESHIIISPYELYTKMSFRNRCVIPTANGMVSLSIPLVGGRENRKQMKDVVIDHQADWQQIHWRTITSAYGRSPWFEFFRDDLEKFYLQKYELLMDWNLDLLQWIYTIIGVKIRIEIPETDSINGLENPFLDLRNKILPKNFQALNIISECPVYAQVFQEKIGFQPNMSIIDLIFCEGKNTRTLLG